jgi:hypothetical protein
MQVGLVGVVVVMKEDSSKGVGVPVQMVKDYLLAAGTTAAAGAEAGVVLGFPWRG